MKSIYLSSEFVWKILGQIFIRPCLLDTTAFIFLNCSGSICKQFEGHKATKYNSEDIANYHMKNSDK